MIKALNLKTKSLEFELNISIKCFKLSFKTNEKALHPNKISAFSRFILYKSTNNPKLKRSRISLVYQH